MSSYTLEPIGFIRSTVKGREDAPRQGPEGAPDAWLEIEPRFAEALLGMEVGHELILITWLHEARRHVLKGHPRSDESRPLTGVFYTRSPARPNPLGLHPVTVRAIERHTHKDRADRSLRRHAGGRYQIRVDPRRRMIGAGMKRFGMQMWVCLSVTFAIGGAALAQTPSPNEKKTISITWLGHAAFEIVSSGGTHLLIDPFLTKNPATPAENKDLARYHPSHILVTHSHGDHLGDAVELAKLSKAKLVSVMMLNTFVTKGGLPREQIETVNVGDQVTAGDVKIHVVPAMHSSEPSGRPVGYVLEFGDGRTLYDEGDTWIFGDMSLIQEFYHPNIILMGCGAVADGQYARMAWLAVNRYFKPQVVIPMHYGALPGSSSEADIRAVVGNDARVKFMKPGETRKF